MNIKIFRICSKNLQIQIMNFRFFLYKYHLLVYHEFFFISTIKSVLKCRNNLILIEFLILFSCITKKRERMELILTKFT